MVPSDFKGKSLGDIVTRYELELLEEADVFGYLSGDAEFSLRPIHGDDDSHTEYGHKEVLRVKLDSLDLPAKKMTVRVSENYVPGICITGKLTLDFDNFDGNSHLQAVTCSGGLYYDASVKTRADEWFDIFSPADAA